MIAYISAVSRLYLGGMREARARAAAACIGISA